MLYQFLWIFFVYAFLGWCTEVSYAATKSGKFVNRGFLNGPWCPIYGFGVVIVLAFLEPLKNNLFFLFLGSVVLTSALEWLTGFLLEKLFSQRWWDYSDEPFNLGGYICLRFSLAWGFACVFVVKLLHPTVLLLIRLIPRPVGMILLALLGAVMAVDLAATVSTIAKLNRRLALIDELAGRIKAASNDFGEDLADRVLDAAERRADWEEDLDELSDRLAQRRDAFNDNLEDLKDDFQVKLDARRTQNRRQLQEWKESIQALMDKETFGQKRLMKAFPKLRSIRHRATMERLLRRHDKL